MNAISTSRNSAVCRLLSSQGRTFALDRSMPGMFDKLVSAASCGFPRSLLVAAQSTLKDAVARGETLSPRSAELFELVNKSLRTPALLRASLH